jgi:hypothetical protein
MSHREERILMIARLNMEEKDPLSSLRIAKT